MNPESMTVKGLIMKNILFIITIICIFSSCITTQVPKNYIADKDVVFLQQKTELKPIAYPISRESPYKWDYIVSESSNDNPSYKQISKFDSLLKPDPMMDQKIFLEIKDYLVHFKNSDFLTEIMDKLNSYNYLKPQQKQIAKGNQIKKFTNAIEYEYPIEENASIIYFNDGSYQINYSDGREYTQKKDSSYFEFDKNKKELYAVFPEETSFRITENDEIYEIHDGERSLRTKEYKIFKTTNPIPQYGIEIFNSKEKYYVFISENNEILALKNINKYNIGFLYGLPTDEKEDYVHINSTDNLIIQIENNFQKIYAIYNNTTRKIEKIVSIYFDEGIFLTDFYSEITYSEINPQWPENYSKKQIGNFNVFFTTKDTELIKRIKSTKLLELSNLLKEKLPSLSKQTEV